MRQMLEKYGGSLEVTKRVEKEETEDLMTLKKFIQDPFSGAMPGTTINWDNLNATCLKYQIVREVTIAFESLMRDKIPIGRVELETLVRVHTASEPP